MLGGISRRARSVVHAVVADLRADRVLRGTLVLAAVLVGFWFWYRVPNFGTPDEYSRLIDPMKAAGRVAADPGIEALRAGILDGRALGATFYLYGLVLAPLGLYILLTGQLDTFATLGEYSSRWTLWYAAPDWFWTAAILSGRLAVIALAVGCVYVTYRIGTELVDRTAGRVAGLLLTLSFGFVSTAHEAGEDIPMLFFFLVALLLTVRYVDEGKVATFVTAALFGGLAIAIKLTAGVIVFLLGGALVVRLVRYSDGLQELAKPFLYGLFVGIVSVGVGIPSVLVGGPGELLTRVFGTAGQKVGTQTGPPIWYWLLRQYLRALGFPMLLAVVGGVGAALLRWVRRPWHDEYGEILVFVGLACYLIVFYQWGFIRVHHLLPTIPLWVLLLSGVISREVDFEAGGAGRLLVAGLLVTSGIFVAGGVGHYANDPRESATDWLEEDAGPNASVEVYENSIADVGVPRRLAISRYPFVEQTQGYDGKLVRNESAFVSWMRSMPDRDPTYIQLTDRELRYLDEGTAYPMRGAFVRDLLNGEYEYEVVARFGPGRRTSEGGMELIRAGVFAYPDKMPRTVIILKRT